MFLQCFSTSCIRVSSICSPLPLGAPGCSSGSAHQAVIWSQAVQCIPLGSLCSLLHCPHPLCLPHISESSHLSSPASFAFAKRALPVSTGGLSFQSYSPTLGQDDKWSSSSDLWDQVSYRGGLPDFWGCRSSLQAAGIIQENLPPLSLKVSLHSPSFSYRAGQAEAWALLQFCS